MKALLALSLAFTCALGGCQPRAESAARPNVMLVLLDTTRPDHLGAYGYERATSPFLDRIAQRSAVFENAYSSSSSTAPATSSLFTGLYPRDHGVTQGFFAHQREVKNLERKGETPLPLNRIPAGARTLPERLREHGYRGFGIGANINIGDEIGFSRGFEKFERMHRADAEEVRARLEQWEPEIREGDSPWFLYLHLNDAHEPYAEREPWFSQWVEQAGQTGDTRIGDTRTEDTKMEAYDSEIRFLDTALAGIWERFGDAGRTLLIVVSDHGEEFGEHGGRGHGFSLHRELNHIVLIVHPPGGLEATRRLSTPVSIVDVLPTLEALLGLSSNAAGSGVSLAELIEGQPAAAPLHMRPIFAQKKRRWRGVREIFSVVQGGWKLIERSGKPAKLYELAPDPGEQSDLASERPERVEQLSTVLEAYRSSPPRFAPSEAGVTLDRERLEHLRALGYVDP